MINKDFSFMKTLKKAKKEFPAGTPRYCQSCGKESNKLFQIDKKTKTKNPLYYCETCKEKSKKIIK